MQIYQVNLMGRARNTTEEKVRAELDRLLEGSRFGVASVERDYEQEAEEGGTDEDPN